MLEAQQKRKQEKLKKQQDEQYRLQKFERDFDLTVLFTLNKPLTQKDSQIDLDSTFLSFG